MKNNRIPINHVFTPRSSNVNPDMYIPRPDHERDLKRAIEGSMHTIVSGASGTGKSWLCKKVAHEQGWTTKFANCANASRLNSVTEELCQTLIPLGTQSQTGYRSSMEGGIGAIGLAGKIGTERTFTVAPQERLSLAFSSARSEAGSNRLIIVLDNLESIFSQKHLMQELGNILLLLDDARYAQYNLKFLLIGIPSEIREYYHKIPDLEPVSNRVSEITPLRSLSSLQVRQLIKAGFQNQLLVILDEKMLSSWSSHVYHVTLGLAQRVHEYCEILAYEVQESGWKPTIKHLEVADSKFMLSSLQKSYAVVESCMNERQTKTSRRNQVLFTLGQIGAPEFDAKFVETRLRSIFPNSTNGVSLGIGPILSELCEPEKALLRRISKTNYFSFIDPKSIMCLRMMLAKGDDDSVQKLLIRM